MSDDEWRRRVSGDGAQQFVAVRSTGADPDPWVGMAVVVLERPDYVSVNAVYVVPDVRGTGVAEKLFAAAIAWTWDRADRLHLWVHEGNPRAQAFYRRLGFVPTGKSMASPLDPGMTEFEWVLPKCADSAGS